MTKPQAEAWAAGNIERAGFPCFVPTFLGKSRVEPLFPRYAFVQLPLGEPWTPVRYAPGVAALLMSNGFPQYARAGTVEALQATEGVRRTLTPAGSVWRPGAACVVAQGALQGQAGVVERFRGEKASIAVMMLGALRSVTIPICMLARPA